MLMSLLIQLMEKIDANCTGYQLALQPLGPHVAPNGVLLMDNGDGDGDRVLLIAEHGSWNRAEFIGYRVGKVVINDDDEVVEHSVFVDGWLNTEKQLYSGRPTHLALLHDKSILISDDFANTIYRVWYDESVVDNDKTIEQQLIGGQIVKIAN